MSTTLTSLSRSSILEVLAEARRQTDELFAIVHPDALYDRPIPERHRIVFYIGHLEAFDWNLLHERVFGVQSFHPEFDNLFAFGIDPVGGGLPNDQPSAWPTISEVRDYVSKIRAALDEKMREALNSDHIDHAEFSLHTFLNVAVEHRLMHAETLAYMLHQLPLNRKIHQIEFPTPQVAPPSPQNVDVPAGMVTLGLSRSSGAFGWDNEFETHTVHVPAFSIDRYKVTNGEYLDFMLAGGYEKRELWTPDNWHWITDNKISHPAFWKRDERNGKSWLYRTMFNDVSLPREWPVYVSQAEASAFAEWAGKSLPTEAQWQRAACSDRRGGQNTYPWGEQSPSEKLGNFDFHRWNPTPVSAYPAGASDFGAEDMLGNGWEWTSTPFAPFPGFKAFSFYPGYSANFFDGKHYVMKGGSARTAASMLRPTFRNWFQAQYQFVYAGFRCVGRQFLSGAN